MSSLDCYPKLWPKNGYLMLLTKFEYSISKRDSKKKQDIRKRSNGFWGASVVLSDSMNDFMKNSYLIM